MFRLRIIALFSVLVSSLLSACSDIRSVQVQSGTTLASLIINDFSNDAVTISPINLPGFGEYLNISLTDLFIGSSYSSTDIASVNFQYEVVESDFSDTGFNLDPATGLLTGTALPYSQITDENISGSDINDCIGVGSKAYTLKITNPDTNASVFKAFNVIKNCDDCGNLAPYAQYVLQ